MTKKIVNVTVRDTQDSQVTTAGGHIGPGGPSPAGEDVEVRVEVQNVERAQVATAGSNIAAVQEMNDALSQILAALSPHLNEQQAADLQGIVEDVQAAAQQPPEQRNPSRLRRLLSGIGEYIGLAALAAAQAQQIAALVDKVKTILHIG